MYDFRKKKKRRKGKWKSYFDGDWRKLVEASGTSLKAIDGDWRKLVEASGTSLKAIGGSEES
jgi:hypothetical protein